MIKPFEHIELFDDFLLELVARSRLVNNLDRACGTRLLVNALVDTSIGSRTEMVALVVSIR